MQKFLIITIFLIISYLSNSQTTISAGNDTTICYGTPATLGAIVTGGSYGTSSYTFQAIPYAPEPFLGGTSVCPSFTNCQSTAGGKDDCVSGPFDIGFSFCFFNVTYTQFWIGSNGWISFSQPPGTDWDTFVATPLPNAAPTVPKNAIFFPWEDWLPCLNDATDVYFYTSGSAPNRKLVVYWSSTTFFNTPCRNTLHATFQAVLNEQTSVIENNIAIKPQCGNEKATQGVQNIDGTVAFTATGRNFQQWTANDESTRFVPDGITWYAGTYPGGTIAGYGSSITVNPAITTKYFAVVETCGAGSATDSVVVTVINPAFNYSKLNYCQNEPNPTPIVTQSGGIFYSTAGLVFISSATGQINLGASTPGSYTITYTLGTTTPCSSIHTVNINAVPAAPGGGTNVLRCDPGTVTFTAIAGQPTDTINWYDAASGGTKLASNTLTFTTPVLLVTTTYWAEAVNSGCTSITRTAFTATIGAKPVLMNNPPDSSLCSGQSTGINLLSNMPGTTFSWIVKPGNCSANILTCPGPGAGNTISNTLTLTNFIAGSVIYTITPFAAGCLGDTASYSVVVDPYPAPASSISGPNNICELASMVVYTIPPITNATQYIWTVVPPGAGTFSGTTQTVNMTWASGFSGSATIFVKGNNSCGDGTISAGYPVTVNPTPSVTNSSPDSSLCTGQPTAIVLRSNVAGTNFTWLIKPGNCSANIVTCPSPGSGSTIINTLAVNNTNQGTVIYSIIPVAATCTGDTFSYTVTVKPLPGAAGTISGMNPVCQASGGIIYSVPPIGAAMQNNWSVVPANAGSLTGTLQNVTMNWSPAFNGTASLYVQGQNVCGTGAISPVYSVPVHPNPVVSFTLCSDTVTTTNAKPFKLKGGIPLGGTYSGPGIASGTFDPAAAGPGVKSIQYSYTNTWACTGAAIRNMNVLIAPAFACGNTFTDVRDNKNYGTVKISAQCWMTENLNFGTTLLLAIAQRDNCTFERYCFNDNPANCSLYGGLYQWDEIMDYSATESVKGICPPAWHVPSETEWQVLFNQFNSNGFAGSPLKSSGFSGFDALLTGAGFHETNWNFFNFATFLWSSTREGPYQAWAHGMNSIVPSVSFYPSSRTNAFFLRCLHD